MEPRAFAACALSALVTCTAAAAGQSGDPAWTGAKNDSSYGVIASAHTDSATTPWVSVGVARLFTQSDGLCSSPQLYGAGDWCSRARAQILREVGLGDNFDAQGTAAPNAKAVKLAYLALDAAERHSLEPASIRASAEEGLGFLFVRDARLAVLECYNTGEMALALQDRAAGGVRACGVKANGLDGAFARIGEFLVGAERL